MSLILEALKKSEAERRLGRAPDLMTPMPVTGVRRSRAPFGIGLAVVALLVAGAAAWWLWSGNTPPETPAPAGVAAPPLAAPDAAVSGPDASATPEAASGRGGTETEVAAPRSRPAPLPALRADEPRDDADVPAPADPEFGSVERESIAVLPGRLPSPSPSKPAPAQVAPTRPLAPSGPPPAPAPEASARVGDPLGLASADLPRLDQLSAQERESLPPLKVSMHLYAEDPAARFVLIDGRRYTGGESIAPSLRIVEIRREGTELDFNGHHFLLPRP